MRTELHLSLELPESGTAAAAIYDAYRHMRPVASEPDSTNDPDRETPLRAVIANKPVGLLVAYSTRFGLRIVGEYFSESPIPEDEIVKVVITDVVPAIPGVPRFREESGALIGRGPDDPTYAFRVHAGMVGEQAVWLLEVRSQTLTGANQVFTRLRGGSTPAYTGNNQDRFAPWSAIGL